MLYELNKMYIKKFTNNYEYGLNTLLLLNEL